MPFQKTFVAIQWLGQDLRKSENKLAKKTLKLYFNRASQAGLVLNTYKKGFLGVKLLTIYYFTNMGLR